MVCATLVVWLVWVPMPMPVPVECGLQWSAGVAGPVQMFGAIGLGVGNYIVVTGGGSTAVSRYDVAAQTWDHTSLTASAARSWCGAAALPTLGLAFWGGGQLASGSYLLSVDVYSGSTGAFSTLPGGLSQARSLLTAVAIAERYVMWCGGDLSSGLTSNRCDLYDARTSTWSTTTWLGPARDAPGAAAMGSRAYFAGGSVDIIGTEASTAVDIFDTVTMSWVTTSLALSVARWYPVGVTLGNNLYFVGGSGPAATTGADYIRYARVDIFSSTGVATQADLAVAREVPLSCVFALGGAGLVACGGVGAGGVLASAETYDVTSGAWSLNSTALHVARERAACGVSLDGKTAVVVGGSPINAIDIVNNVCSVSNCAWCTFGSRTVCAACNSGYLLTGGFCAPLTGETPRSSTGTARPPVGAVSPASTSSSFSWTSAGGVVVIVVIVVVAVLALLLALICCFRPRWLSRRPLLPTDAPARASDASRGSMVPVVATSATAAAGGGRLSDGDKGGAGGTGGTGDMGDKGGVGVMPAPYLVMPAAYASTEPYQQLAKGPMAAPPPPPLTPPPPPPPEMLAYPPEPRNTLGGLWPGSHIVAHSEAAARGAPVRTPMIVDAAPATPPLLLSTSAARLVDAAPDAGAVAVAGAAAASGSFGGSASGSPFPSSSSSPSPYQSAVSRSDELQQKGPVLPRPSDGQHEQQAGSSNADAAPARAPVPFSPGAITVG